MQYARLPSSISYSITATSSDLILNLPKVFINHNTKGKKPQIRLLYMTYTNFKTSEIMN